MGKCYKGKYKDNIVVTHTPFVCFGGFGQPECEYLDKCLAEYGKKRRKKKAKQKKD